MVRRARLEEDEPVENHPQGCGRIPHLQGKNRRLVERRTEAGFAKGDAHIEGIDEYAGQRLQLSFQNEHLAARIDGEFKVTVPDLLAVLDVDTGEPITTEGLRYGFRVAIIAIPCAEKWRTPKGLELVGPGYFGYETDYVPVEERYG